MQLIRDMIDAIPQPFVAQEKVELCTMVFAHLHRNIAPASLFFGFPIGFCTSKAQDARSSSRKMAFRLGATRC